MPYRPFVRLPSVLSSLLLSLPLVALGCGEPASGPGPDPDPAPDAAVPAGAFTIVPARDRLPILHGTTAQLELAITRAPGFTRAITVEALDLPAGVAAEPLAIADGATTAVLELRADTAAAHSLPTSVTLRGRAATGEEASASLAVTVTGLPGALDTSFAGGKVLVPAGISDDFASAIAIQPDGKLLVAGEAAEHRGDFALVRLERDGTLDPTFGTGGKVLTDFAGDADAIHAIALQPDGKIVVAGTTVSTGSSRDFALARYLPDGSLDPQFGTAGKVVTVVGADSDSANAILVQPDGKLLVGGDSNRGTNAGGVDFALARYTAAGALDASFGAGGLVITSLAPNGARDSINALALQDAGGEPRIVAVGGEGDFTIARYRADGQLDASFGAGGKVTNVFGSTIGAARAVRVTPAGALVVAGHAQHDFALLQLTAAGQLDASFGTGGKVITRLSTTNFDEVQALALDAEGKVIAGGWVFEGQSSAGNFAVVRYAADGRLDGDFGQGGIVVTPVAAGTKADQAMAVALQVDDRVPTVRIVAAGFANVTDNDFAVARYWQ